MLIVSVISFCVAGFLVLDSIFRKSDLFSPVRIYLFFHSLTLGIAFLALDKAMTPFHPFTSLVYFGSGACFVLGAWTARLLSDLFDRNTPSQPLERGQYNWKLHFCFAFFLFIVFICGMIAARQGIGTFPLLAKNKAKAIHDFFRVTWFASVALSFGGITMALFFMTIFRPRRLPKILNFGFWVTVFSTLFFSLALSRSGLIFFAFFAMVFYHQAIKRISVGKLSIFFLLFFTVFLTTGYLKLSDFEKDHSLNYKPYYVFVSLLKLPYVYVANNYWNLDYALNPGNYQTRAPDTYGFTTVSGVLDMMILPGGALGSNIRESYHFDDQFNKQSVKVKGLNTMTYQWGLYKDFGLFGVFVFPFLFGILIGHVYSRIRERPTVLNLALYSYLAFYVGLSWFLAFWESMIYLYGFAYVAVCCYLCQRPSSARALPTQIASDPSRPF